MEILQISFWSLLNSLTWAGFSCCPFLFLCAFVKKGTAITGKGRNTPKGRMISICFPPFSKQTSITCCHLQFKELLKKSHIKAEERRAHQVFFFLLSPFPCSDMSLRPDPPRQFTTWISVLFWSFISPSFMSPSATCCHHRRGHNWCIRQELGVSSQSTDLELGLKEPSHDLGEVTLSSSPLERST